MAGQEPRRRRREQLEAMLAGGQARLERARSRSLVVDTTVGVARRERPVAVAVLAAALAFRLFALVVPLSYLVVAGLGFAGEDSVHPARPGVGDHLGDLVLSSVAEAARSSQLARWLGLIFGGVATLLAAVAVLEVLRWVHLLAWRMAPVRSRPGPWLVLGLLAGLAVMSAASTVAEAARASTVYGSLGVALTLLVSLFLFARLAVAAAELNATLWERRPL